MRTITIGVFSFCGGIFLSQGAARESWRLMMFGILLLCLALGIIMSRHPSTRTVRSHARAIWYALIIHRLLRRRS
jgi:Na+-driven multidrug efflux pump